MQRRLGLFAVMLVVGGAAAAAQTSPSGWKIVKDVRKTCQIAVPPDWTEGTGTGYSPGKSVTATVHALRQGQTFEDGKTLAKQVMKPIKIMQDDGKRLMYTMNPGNLQGGNNNGWYVVVNTVPVCTVSFTFAGQNDEATLRKIADSLGVAK